MKNTRPVKLEFQNGEILEVKYESALKCEQFTEYLENNSELKPEMKINLDNIQLHIVKKIFEYCDYITLEGVEEPTVERPLKHKNIAHKANGIKDQWFVDYAKSIPES